MILSTGLDHHKKYSVLVTMDEAGKIIKRGRIYGHDRESVRKYFGDLKHKTRVVHEAGWNWDLMHELLEEDPQVEEVILAHPANTRIIAEATIKTDEIDAEKLAMLLRGDFVSRVHAPCKETREKKRILRQRTHYVRERTRARNRIHTIMDREKDIKIPPVRDLFGAKGMNFLKEVEISSSGKYLLDQELKFHEMVQKTISDLEKKMGKEILKLKDVELLMTIPGIGKITGSAIALEIDEVKRFRDNSHLCSYAGLVPRTYSSGGKTSQGGLVEHGNKWLKSALIEASWVSIVHSRYFKDLYEHHRNRGKKAPVSIVAVARRLCQIVYRVLKENKGFEEDYASKKNFPSRSVVGLKVISR